MLPATFVGLVIIGCALSALSLQGLAGSERRIQMAVSGGPLSLLVLVITLQQLILRHYLPDGFLPYGFFLEALGKRARFWILVFPYFTLIALLLLFCAGLSSWLVKRKFRSAALALWLWSSILALVYSFYCGYLLLQGDAAIFI